MAVTIDGVQPDSRAARAGIQPGDVLLRINGTEVTDVLDFRFLETERRLTVDLARAGEPYTVEIAKPQYAPLGLEFETYLMDRQRSCRNKCVFCFIDQLPKGMRPTLYFKDDDDRLSFLFGNYITLTNIDDREIDRILKLRISPINVSVHTMDPALRVTMMGNRFAGESLRHLYRLAEGGIQLNCQIVLCPGLNDGDALEYTLSEFFKLGESLLSVACVPVGVTRYREGLYPLTPFTPETAAAAIDQLERWGERFKAERGTRTVFASDELYLMAGRPIPPLEFYEDFPQIENGVGMLRDLQDTFDWALEDLEEAGELTLSAPRHVTVPTGECAYPFIRELLTHLTDRVPELTIDLVPVHNDFFGGGVNVTGLLTGQDLLKNLKGRPLGEEVLIVSNMLKADQDIFLDDMTLDQLSAALGVPCRRTRYAGDAMAASLLGREPVTGPEHNPYEGAGSWEHA